MLRKLVFMLLIVTLALTTSSAFGDVWRYWGNADPETCLIFTGTDGPEGFGIFEEYGNTASGGVVFDDPAAIDGKAWRVNDTDAVLNYLWRTPGVFDLGSTTGATIVARIKTLSDTNGGGNIGIAQQNYGSFIHWGGANGDLTETVRSNTVTIPGNGNYHTIRLTAKGEQTGYTIPYTENFNAYSDGLLNRGSIGWDAIGSNAGAEISVTGGEVSLTGALNKFAARTLLANPTAAGKITITARVYCASTTWVDGWVYNLDFLDANGVQLAGWQGVASAIKGRCGGLATNIANGNLAVGWNDLRCEIDVITNTAKYYVNNIDQGNDAITGAPISGFAAAGNRLGYVRFVSFNDSRSASTTVKFDDIVVTEGTEVPNSSRLINIYVDDVLKNSITYASTGNIPQTGSTRTDNFVFGSGAGVQDVYFDSIVMTNDGAFAPGDDAAQFGAPLLPGTAVTGFGDIATAPVGSEVVLDDAQVTAIFMGENGPEAFAVSDPEQYAGIRVVSSAVVYIQNLVDIIGTIAVVDGERVVIASSVIDTTVTATNPVKPLAVSNKSAAGGASGAQPAMVDNASKITGGPSFADSFAYTNGPLAGKGGWTGDGGSAFAIENGVLKMTAFSWDYPVDYPIVVTKAVSAGDCGTGEISLKLKVKKGTATGNFWYLRIKDSAGIEICYIMGQGSSLVVRTGTYVPAAQNLTGNWDNVEIKITGGTTAQFFFNGAPAGSTTVIGNGSIGSLVFERPYHTADAGSYAYLDDIQIFPATGTGTGLNTVGVLSTIFGRVTHVKSSTPSTWDDYFYIDDGTGYIDGTVDGSAANIGIRCRPSSKFFQLNGMPTAGQFVTVTGVMGAKNDSGNNIRFFWTDSYSVVEEL